MLLVLEVIVADLQLHDAEKRRRELELGELLVDLAQLVALENSEREGDVLGRLLAHRVLGSSPCL